MAKPDQTDSLKGSQKAEPEDPFNKPAGAPAQHSKLGSGGAMPLPGRDQVEEPQNPAAVEVEIPATVERDQT